MILYKSKIDLLSTLIVREANKIFQKGNFIQYLDAHQNFWSVLFESESDRDEAIRLLEERCTIQRDEMEKSINASEIKVGESENNEHDNAKAEGEGGTSDKACETDPEEKQTKAMKANILSRMARMGKKIVLPNKTSNSEVSDSSDADNSPKRKPNVANSSPVLQVAKLQHGPTAHSTAHTVEFVKHAHGNNVISAASSDSSLNLMMMQNTEIRFNLSKLDSKLDKLCDKLEVISTNSASLSSNDKNNNDSVREEDIMRLEEKLLSIKRENLNLKSINRDMEERLRNKSESSDELNELKAQLKAAQQDNKNISIELEAKGEKILAMEAKVRDSVEAREIQSRNNEADLAELRSQLHLSTRDIKELQLKLDRFKKPRDTTSATGSATKESQTEGKPVSAPSDVMIKEMMNNLYLKLCDKISNANDIKQSEILKIIGQTIRQETSECLKKHSHSS